MSAEPITFIGPDPPPSKAGVKTGQPNTRWNRVVNELKTRPGEWALVGEGVSPNVQQLLKQRGCDAVTRNGRLNSARTSFVYDIYACWPKESE